jgi:uncharacterized protein
MTEIAPNAYGPAGRDRLPDLIRVFALFGIAVVNVMGFSWPMTVGYFEGALQSNTDRAADFAVNAFFTAKSYPLFSMMFGAGLAYQMHAAESAGANFSQRYFRRMGLFAGLGILHAIFFWLGDILLTYALLGMLLFLCRGMQPRALWRLGILMLVINVLFLAATACSILVMQTFAPEALKEAAGQDFITTGARKAFGESGFFGAALHRAMLLPLTLPGVISQQGLAVFGFFCFGLAILKSGLLADPRHVFWRRARHVFMPLGLTGSLAGAWLASTSAGLLDARFLFGLTSLIAASPFSALGYAGWIAKWAASADGPVTAFLARAGSATLSAYLFQSLCLSLVFTAYGLGQFEKLGAAEAILTGAGVALLSIVFVGLWRSVFARGPLEMLVRRFTYGGRRPASS